MESKNKQTIKQFIKFSLIGMMNTAIDIVIELLLNAVFGLFVLAKVIGYSVGVINSYFFNSSWTFKEEKRRDAREIISFIVVNLIAFGISLLLQLLFKYSFHLGDWWMNFAGENWFTSHIVSGDGFCILLSAAVAIVINFTGNKLFVFNRKAAEE